MKNQTLVPDIAWTDDDGIVHIRNSERGTLNKCPQRWWWNWREGWEPKETAKALWFGTGIHLALADFYQPGKKRSKDYVDLWRQYADEEANYMRIDDRRGLNEDEFIEARALGETMLINYATHWGKDKHWNVIATEQSFDVRIPFNRPHPVFGDYFILNGTFDGVYYDEDAKCFKLMEHKTAKSISVRHLPMDNQAGTYWAVAMTVGRSKGWLGKKDNIKEITYNFLRKAVPDERPKDEKGYATNKPNKGHYYEALKDLYDFPETRTGTPKLPTIEVLEEMAADSNVIVLGDRSANQPQALYERHAVKRRAVQRKTQVQRIKDEVDRMVLYVEGSLAVTKNPSRDTCPMCPFSEMCELHEAEGNWIDFRDLVFKKRDPYADHRKDAGSA